MRYTIMLFLALFGCSADVADPGQIHEEPGPRCDDGCVSAEHMTALCAITDHAVCERACDAGWDDCDDDPVNGCEVNIMLHDNCGACGVACSSDQHCGPGCNDVFSCYPSPTNCTP